MEDPLGHVLQSAGGGVAWCVMPQLPDRSRRSTRLYRWLAEREQRAVDEGELPWTAEAGGWDGDRGRLERFRRGEPVDLPLDGLPRWARNGEPPQWWQRVIVHANGRMDFYHDNGSMWRAEAGI